MIIQKMCNLGYFALIAIVLLGLMATAHTQTKKLVLASWYGKNHQGNRMANGQPFNMYNLTAAHRSLPLGSCIRVTNTKNNKSVVVKILDRGPYVVGRTLDLSMAAAKAIGTIGLGVALVTIEKVGCN